MAAIPAPSKFIARTSESGRNVLPLQPSTGLKKKSAQQPSSSFTHLVADETQKFNYITFLPSTSCRFCIVPYLSTCSIAGSFPIFLQPHHPKPSTNNHDVGTPSDRHHRRILRRHPHRPRPPQRCHPRRLHLNKTKLQSDHDLTLRSLLVENRRTASHRQPQQISRRTRPPPHRRRLQILLPRAIRVHQGLRRIHRPHHQDPPSHRR